MTSDTIIATGRRKTATAQVRLNPNGDGTIEVNNRGFDNYFPGDVLRGKVLRPLILADRARQTSVSVKIKGGGITAQAEALAHGITRALLILDESLRTVLKKEGLITRDSRMKERKKYGQKGARKRFQFSKR